MLKDEQLRKNETQLKLDHTMQVMKIYSQELDSSQKTIQLSGQILKDNYLLLSAKMCLTEKMQEKYENLSKFGQRNVRFTENDDMPQNDLDVNEINHVHPNDVMISDDDSLLNVEPDEYVMNGEGSGHGSKRVRDSEDDEKPTKKFARAIFSNFPSNLNSTQVLDDLTADDVKKLPVVDNEITYGVQPNTSTVISQRHPLTTRYPNLNINKDFSMPKAKAVKKVTKPVSSLVQTLREKENKRTPKRVSPRQNRSMLFK